MTEVTRSSSAMVREPTAIHSAADECGGSSRNELLENMPDLSSETKLRKSRPSNRSAASSPTDHASDLHKNNNSSGDEDGSHEEDSGVPSTNNNEDTAKNNVSSSWSLQQASDLSGKVQELHDTLTRLKKESDDQIQRLKRESEDATKTIAKLQMQLQQQSDYELLKREVQLLKTMGNLGSKSGPPSSSLTPPPPLPPSLSNMGGSSQTSPGSGSSGGPTLEMLLVERAKAIQQASPALKAFADMQGSNFPGLGGPIRHPLFQSSGGAVDPTLGIMNDEMLAQWRRTLGSFEQGPLAGLTALSCSPLTPPISSGPVMTSGSAGRKSPSSPDIREAPGTPSNGRPSPGPEENSNLSHDEHSLTNGGDDKAHSEGDIGSPSRAEESKSPQKLSSEEPQGPLTFPSTPSASQLTASIANHFPPLNTNHMSLSLHLPLSVPPLMSTGRIPKSDPMEGKLQDMLRYNMEKFAGQPLDTLGMSRRVRELLSIHNIGQRLFAKYVLGLSQGTVSELLSKPKSWDKLTEKGRDSYRKMHAWAYDENAVMMLKSLIPRKGELMRPVSQAPPGLLLKEDRPNSTSLGPSAGFPYGQNGNEERIAKILSEANKAMAAGGGVTSKDSTGIPVSASSGPVGLAGSDGDSPQERMSKLYQEELSRLMQSQQRARIQEKTGLPQDLPGLPGLFPGLAGGLFQRAQQSDLQRAMEVYQQEFNRLQQNALSAAFRAQQNGKEDENGQKLEAPNPPESPATSSGDTKSPGARQESPLGKGPGSGLFPSGDVDLVGSLSPLQRMASITNSLVSQPPLPGQPQMNRPNRASLPPITQQQFDRFSHLNTDEVVRRVKDILSQYSISQRLFGESVLGLSQGSVSDLLARPKPWHMLTQKGREPFIRMKLFLDDENAVHKLVASQYKIAPEKLMRTGSYGGGGSPFNQAPKQMPKLPDFPRGLPEAPVLPSSLRFGGQDASSILDRPPPLLDPLLLHRKLLSQKLGPGLGSGLGGGAPSQSLYEMAALTHEMDTQAVTTKVKEILLANNVGQKLFGEHVLGLSQGSVSELLSKPKPWHMLSIKGREPFIRMQLWLNDPTSIDKLQAVKRDTKEGSSKRKRSFPGGPGSGMGDSGSDRSSPAADTPGPDPYSADSPGSASAKKPRVYFSEEQKEALKIGFALDPYPSTSTMEFLSQELGLEVRSISNWFHNHRMRLKQQLPQAMDSLAILANREGGQSTFDPVKFRLLMHQRILEMQCPEEAAANTNSVTSLLRQFSSIQNSNPSSPLAPSSGGGLDLSYKREDDDDKDSIAESQRSADHDESSNAEANLVATPPQTTSSRSRRKPAAPQWVRPEWNKVPEGGPQQSNGNSADAPANATAANKSDLTINGVCVMNSAAYRASLTSDPEDLEDSQSKPVCSDQEGN